MTVCGRWAGRDGRRGRSKRPSRTGMARVAGTFGCPMDGSDTGVAVRQEVESFAAVLAPSIGGFGLRVGVRFYLAYTRRFNVESGI